METIDVKKIISVTGVTPSKFPGRLLVTCDYMGNSSYQFLIDETEFDSFQKSLEFHPEQTDKE